MLFTFQTTGQTLTPFCPCELRVLINQLSVVGLEIQKESLTEIIHKSQIYEKKLGYIKNSEIL